MKNFFSLLGLTSALIFTSLFTPVFAHSAKRKIPLSNQSTKHLTITSVEVTDITNVYDNFSAEYEYNITLNDWISTPIDATLDKVDLIVDKVINIGQKIWTVVEKGRPVANYSSANANALPANASRWDQLQNWNQPTSKVVSVVYKNAFGMEVINFKYRILLLSGGSANGVGKYIGYATVQPLEMTVAYMYAFNVKASVDSVYNMGTKKNPLAGMILNINWTVETVLKKSTMTHSYALDGLGNIAVPASKFYQLQ